MNAHKTNSSNVGWRFWLLWVVGTTLGWMLSFILSFIVLGIIIAVITGNPDPEAADLPFAPFLILMFTIAGSGMGSAQWVLLRRHLEKARRWIPATGLGMSMIGLFYFILGGESADTAGVIIHNTLAGMVLGVLQWFILRRTIEDSGWWVLASFITYLTGGVLNDLYLQASLGLDGAVSSFVTVAFMATISGAVMIYLLRRPAPELEVAATP